MDIDTAYEDGRRRVRSSKSTLKRDASTFQHWNSFQSAVVHTHPAEQK